MGESAIKSKFISHGTLGSKDLEATRRFYEDSSGSSGAHPAPCR